MRYICEDRVFDDFGRVIVHENKTIHCPIFSLYPSFIEKYNLFPASVAKSTFKETWILSSRPRSFSRFLAGIWDDYESTERLPWCDGYPVETMEFAYNTDPESKDVMLFEGPDGSHK
ncbi:Oidioi.mRNA.OKI2018_I69.chr2.g4485.t1.cds [Oikopleura dioica]|uniref:Oidioi.mRNA.OKI2018_I69.chr2.g4485.t1.cds n=1 Tax=Oikopleura dioica TaxID=34765 RepID=A0ABN7SX33_OIKDI|nr:Oidioi.mRNA.OKI2018_I69.chr2.g4485.t1.cds [Oikopleura dioica]